jgi:hypothetical protein
MTDLSPAAQAILHEFWGAPVSPVRNVQIAAALRAAADQLTPYTVSEMEGAAFARNKLLDIARKLEAQ